MPASIQVLQVWIQAISVSPMCKELLGFAGWYRRTILPSILRPNFYVVVFAVLKSPQLYCSVRPNAGYVSRWSGKLLASWWKRACSTKLLVWIRTPTAKEAEKKSKEQLGGWIAFYDLRRYSSVGIQYGQPPEFDKVSAVVFWRQGTSCRSFKSPYSRREDCRYNVSTSALQIPPWFWKPMQKNCWREIVLQGFIGVSSIFGRFGDARWAFFKNKEFKKVQSCESVNINEDLLVQENTSTLIKMIDILGREQQDHKQGSLLFYIYDNGKVDKKFNP